MNKYLEIIISITLLVLLIITQSLKNETEELRDKLANQILRIDNLYHYMQDTPSDYEEI